MLDLKEGFLGIFEINHNVYHVFFTETEIQVTFKVDVEGETQLIQCDKDKLEILIANLHKEASTPLEEIKKKAGEYAYYAYLKYIQNPITA